MVNMFRVKLHQSMIFSECKINISYSMVLHIIRAYILRVKNTSNVLKCPRVKRLIDIELETGGGGV